MAYSGSDVAGMDVRRKLLSKQTSLLSDLGNVDNVTLPVCRGQAVGLLGVGVNDLPCLVGRDTGGSGGCGEGSEGGEDGECFNHDCLRGRWKWGSEDTAGEETEAFSSQFYRQLGLLV
jgi:hypothetical protein